MWKKEKARVLFCGPVIQQAGRTFLMLCLLAILSGVGPALQAADREPGTLLTPGQLKYGAVDVSSADQEVRYRFRVEEDTYAVAIRMQNAEADLDLIVYDSKDDEFAYAESNDFDETLFLYRLGSPGLENGDYTLSVAYQLDYDPQKNGERMSTIPFALDFKILSMKDARAIEVGRTFGDTLDPAEGMFRAYKVAVPPGTRNLRIDAFDSQADIDLFAEIGRPFGDPRSVAHAGQSYRSREFLVLPVEQATGSRGAATAATTAPAAKGSARTPRVPAAHDGFTYIMVMAEPDEISISFSLRVEAGTEPPEELRKLPDLKPLLGKTGIDRALSATVEILGDNGGGSGVLVSPDGWLVSNFHVVKGKDGKPMKEISIGFSMDHTKVPDSQFRAEVRQYDVLKDIALLKITGGIYGQPLPQGYRFPFVEVAGSRNLKIGDGLSFIGYPTMGGLGSRVTVTYTRGYVSGFQDRGFGVIIKSDGEINSGSSGGAALDAQWRLVGMPTSTVGGESSQLGYIYPIDLLPEPWRREAGVVFGGS